MKKRKILSLLLACVMLVGMLPGALADTSATTGSAEQTETSVASLTQSGGTTTYYDTLAAAVADAGDDSTIKLLKDCQGGGIPIMEDRNLSTGLTIDFATYTYTCTGPGAGSDNTKSQVFHLEKGNKITMINGTIDISPTVQGVRTMFQNYAELTLTNMTLDGTNLLEGNIGGVLFPQKSTFILNCYNDAVTLTGVTIHNSKNSKTAYSIGCGWWPTSYPAGTQITADANCQFDNVLIYRDDDNQTNQNGADHAASTITVGGTTYYGDYKNNASAHYEEYLYQGGKLVANIPTALNVTTAGGITASGSGASYSLSGNVDTRKYTVTDAEVKRLFGTLLGEARTATSNEPIAIAATPVEALYVKAPLNAVFASVEFDFARMDSPYYYIKQTNPGLKAAYPDEPKFQDDTKEGVYSEAALEDGGLVFLVTDKPGDITFEIAPCENANVTAMPNGAATITISNNTTLEESDPPAADVPVVEVTPTVKDDKSAEATVDNTAVSDEKIAAAAGSTEKTLTIDATGGPEAKGVEKIALTLDSNVVKALAEDANGTPTNVSAEIATPVGTVTLSADALAAIKEDATTSGSTSDVVLKVEKVDALSRPTGSTEAFVVKVEKSGGGDITISDLPEHITLSFFVGTGRTDKPVLVYWNSTTSKYEPIESSDYDSATGMLIGTTSHLSTFAMLTEVSGTSTNGGIGKKVTLTAAAQNHYLTIQVANGNANAIYTVKVTDASKQVEIYVPTGSVLSVWETSGVPTFTDGVIAPNGVLSAWVNQTIN